MGMNKLAFWHGKRVLVTGHTGFKGSWLCKLLEIAGAHIIGYALSPPTQPNLYHICNPNVESILGDIRDFDSLKSVFQTKQPEIVFHMAAQPLVINSYRNPRQTYEINIMGTANVMECARLYGHVGSLLNVTTDKVYLSKNSISSYGEDEQLNGYDPYSNSKSCSELVTSSYNNSFFKQMGLSVSTARSGNVIGGGDFADERLVPDCAKALQCGEAIKIRNPNYVRPYQHVLDTLLAYLCIAQKQYGDCSVAGAYNIGPDAEDCISNRELVHCFCQAWGNNATWVHASADYGYESKKLRLNCSKLKQTMGWAPHWNINQAITETVLWYQSYFNGDNPNEIMMRQIGEFL